ncbi:efflux transporter periplasmic adaptor subunit [Bacterioplanes sanyensis]|uniref:Efflux transporter periplasmic adaptor subunit n=1 Tax=Bacterioplanes sanyensis TaxID=1249553 RepID=A0A222FNI6_9GAMM|nr:efflux RND transporter periplasmic adaptor subunit [Bacterioplanes sanyensis]ASP40084.1 efflux transporter periplasmic adaptor subunit [Bacterioplanes sanyensis]
MLQSRFRCVSLAALWLVALHASADVATAQVVTLERNTWIDARIEAVNESTLSAQTAGAVKQLFVDVNDRVQAGELLLTLDATEQRAGVLQAEANVAKAMAQQEDARVLLQRHRQLLQQGTLSQGEFDSTTAAAKSAEAAVAAAKAGLIVAQQQLSYTEIKAPYAGIVKQRHVDIGEWVSPGQALISGFASTPMRAVADVPQYLAQQLSSVSIASQQGLIATNQVTLFPYADPQHHSVRLRARLPETLSLMPGSWAKLAINSGQRQALLVPQSAVLARGEIRSLYVQDGHGAMLRQVRLGGVQTIEQQPWVEVVSGLSEGERYYLDAHQQMAKQGEQP